MKLEDEIKQKVFKSPYQKLTVNILFTSGWLSGVHNKTLKKYGISTQQFNILRILRGQYPKTANVSLLVERMLDKSSNVTRLLDKLVAKGLVTRESCSEDRRKFNITITPKGLELLSSLDTEVNEMENILKNITEEEATLVSDLLDKLRG
jgi:DNA-binding MarR family transcriptional regulator